MTLDQARAELDGTGRYDYSDYAHQVNWNRRYLGVSVKRDWGQFDDGDHLTLLREAWAADSGLDYDAHQLLHGQPWAAAISCQACYPPLPRPEWKTRGLYGQFAKVLNGDAREMAPFLLPTNGGHA